MSRYRFIEAQRSQYLVRLLCQVVAVPVSGYYAWQQAQEQAGSKKKPAWEEALVKVFGRHKRRYGTRRLQVALRRKGYHVGRQRPHGAMRRRGLHALQPKAFTPAPPIRPTGCGAPRTGYSTSPSRRKLTRYGSAIAPICRWPTATGLICARTRTWSASRWWAGTSWPPCRRSWLRPPCSALSGPSRPTPDLLVHSDRGGQYGGKEYRQLLHDHEALRSQSRRGDCYDNAQAESLWSRLKTEVLEMRERPVFANLANAQASVADYFYYYNHERLHSSIGYQTSYHTHQQLLQLNALNCPA
ncbi:MAG: hypothetical protein EOO63_09205 [Hymenobacter sp.]|nr:MAG: hypothetical protein EOO63_09205 [Hymenobacter sp.]